MADKVKPLKIESSATGGTENNFAPTEADPTEDYLACKGIAPGNSDATLIGEDSGAIKFTTSSTLRTTLQSDGGLLHTKHLAVGSSASVSSSIVGQFQEFPSGTGSLTGVYGNVSGPNADSSADTFRGGDFIAQMSGASAKAASLYGISAQIAMDSGAGASALSGAVAGYFTNLFTGTSTTEDVYGLLVSTVVDNTFGTPTIDNLFGIRINASNTGGTITGYQALSIESVSGIGTTNWALAVNGGNSYHVGNLRIGGSTTPTVPLHVTGDGTFSGALTSASLTLTTTPLAISSGGTGQTTAAAAMNALSQLTSTGDIMFRDTFGNTTRLARGTNGYVLQSNATTIAWTAPASSSFWANTLNSGQVDGTSNLLGTSDAMPIRVHAGGTSGGNRKFDVKNAVNDVLSIYPEDFSTSLGGSHSLWKISNNITWAGGSAPTFRANYYANTHTLTGVNLTNLILMETAGLITTAGSASNRSISTYQTIYDHNVLRGDGRDLAISNLRCLDDATQTSIANSGTVTVSNWDTIVMRQTIGSGSTVTTMRSLWLAPTNNGTLTTWYGIKITPPSASTIRSIDVDSGALVFGTGNISVGSTSASTTAQLFVTSSTAANIILNLRGHASQSGAFLNMETSGGAQKFTFYNSNVFRIFGSTSGYVGLKTAAAASSYDITLPADGTSGQYLKTDGSGVWSFATPPGSTRFYTSMGGVNGVGGSVTSSATFNDAGVQDVGFYAKAAGKVTDIAISLSGNRTAGTVTGKWLKNGVVQSGTVAISSAIDKAITSSLSVTYAAGDIITLQTVTSSFTPTGTDAIVTLFHEDT